MKDPGDLSQSLREPQLEPSDHAYTILQDHGPEDGGWGPAAISLPSLGFETGPIIYTGEREETIEKLKQVVETLALGTRKPTVLARYSKREDVFSA